MSNLMKIAIPLLHPDLTLDDINPNNGFVEAYFEDINKPALVNHIFMMYDSKAKGDNVGKCFNKLYHLNNRYGFRVVRIKEKPYYVYSFTVNSTIRNLRDGNIILSPSQKQRVLEFWGHNDAWIVNNILLGVIYEHPEPSILPEEDYVPEMYEDEEGEVLN